MNLFTLAGIAIAVVIVLIIILTGYVKAPTDKAFIITGLKKRPKILIGKAGVKIPFLERKDELDLKLISVNVTTSSPVPTADYINIAIDANVNIQIGHDDEMIEKAARNFLNKSADEIGDMAREVLEGNMREIAGKMALAEMVTDRQKFIQLVTENAEPDLKKMGLIIISFNVQNFADNDEVITNMGIDNISQISKTAAIAKANAEKEVKIAQASAEKEANDARVKAQTEIAEKNNELEIKQAELKQEADTKKAVADAAYEIQKEEQRKTIESTKVNADIAQQERTVELRQKEAEVAEQTLNAEIKKKADADKYRRQQEAEAKLIERQKAAEAEKYEQSQKAEALKLSADAKKYEAEQEAAAIKAKGKAEADAIEAKGIAEAEALTKKADAMKKYGQAAMVEMIVKALPEMAKAVAEPLSTIDKVTIIDSGNGDSGVGSMGDYVPSVLAKTIESVKETTGVDIREIMKAETYDAKVNKNVNIEGLDNLANTNVNVSSEK